MNLDEESDNVRCIFETIINTIEPPKCSIEGTAQMLVSNIEYDDYLGRLAVGRIERVNNQNWYECYCMQKR